MELCGRTGRFDRGTPTAETTRCYQGPLILPAPDTDGPPRAVPVDPAGTAR